VATSDDVIRTRRWNRREYDRLIELGILHEDEPIELLAGRLVVAEPKRPPHAVATDLVASALRHAFGPGWTVRTQAPIALDDLSEPEPDLAVVQGDARAYRDAHPTRPVLAVEIAESSLRLDRGLKHRLYAQAGLQEYWIVNLVDRVLEVYREPVRRGRRSVYGSVEILGPEGVVTPLAAPGARINVADLLP
jgi:Uma2 family endonuclease